MGGNYIIGTVTQTHTLTTTQTITQTITQTRREGSIPTEASIGSPVIIGNWEITVINVRESKYIVKSNSYYEADEGFKLVIITLKIKNTGSSTDQPSNIGSFILVTTSGKSYEITATYEIEPIFEPTEEIIHEAIPYNPIDLYEYLAPGTYMEGDILFEIPVNEQPDRLVFEVWNVDFTIQVNLR
jgi:hypothetical protein